MHSNKQIDCARGEWGGGGWIVTHKLIALAGGGGGGGWIVTHKLIVLADTKNVSRHIHSKMCFVPL